MKKKIRVVKNFKIVKRPCSLNRYYRVNPKRKIRIEIEDRRLLQHFNKLSCLIK